MYHAAVRATCKKYCNRATFSLESHSSAAVYRVYCCFRYSDGTQAHGDCAGLQIELVQQFPFTRDTTFSPRTLRGPPGRRQSPPVDSLALIPANVRHYPQSFHSYFESSPFSPNAPPTISEVRSLRPANNAVYNNSDSRVTKYMESEKILARDSKVARSHSATRPHFIPFGKELRAADRVGVDPLRRRASLFSQGSERTAPRVLFGYSVLAGKGRHV